MKLLLTLMFIIFLGLLVLPAIPLGSSIHSQSAKVPQQMSKIGQTFEIPYQLTETNHFLIRVRINGKGPFNFLVDSGAPALYIATETAKKAALEPSKEHFWTLVQRLDLEGGTVLTNVNARIEDPFQLVGMNALGLPGAMIDGILGFTILARFRLEIDPTRDTMTWTVLDFVPPDPPIPHQPNGNAQERPRELQALSALGPLAKGLAFLMGKQPEEERFLRGFLGFQWHETRPVDGKTCVKVSLVLKGSPADVAGLCSGDHLLSISNQPVSSLKGAQAALAKFQAGDVVQLSVERNIKDGKGTQQLTITMTATEGF